MINTALLILSNVLVGILLAEFYGLRKNVKENRDKLDEHVQNFELHGLSRASGKATG
jgi:hypothetical protein